MTIFCCCWFCRCHTPFYFFSQPGSLILTLLLWVSLWLSSFSLSLSLVFCLSLFPISHTRTQRISKVCRRPYLVRSKSKKMCSHYYSNFVIINFPIFNGSPKISCLSLTVRESTEAERREKIGNVIVLITYSANFLYFCVCWPGLMQNICVEHNNNTHMEAEIRTATMTTTKGLKDPKSAQQQRLLWAKSPESVQNQQQQAKHLDAVQL